MPFEAEVRLIPVVIVGVEDEDKEVEDEDGSVAMAAVVEVAMAVFMVAVVKVGEAGSDAAATSSISMFRDSTSMIANRLVFLR
jgi:hypothetical protein